MDFIGIGSVAAITVICYLLAEAIKAAPIDSKWLPVLCGVMGGVLGVIGWNVMGDFPANDVLTAFAVGIVSGFAATGVNQAFKQLTDK